MPKADNLGSAPEQHVAYNLMNNISYRLTKPQSTRFARAVILQLIGITLPLGGGCGKKPEGTITPNNGNSNTAAASVPGIDSAPIIERYRAVDDTRDYTMKLRAVITSASEGSGGDAPRQIQLNLYRKNHPDGRRLILIEFTSPPEERDRDGLITVFPDGQIEGVRYVQSTNSYIATRDLMSEDALFGMTLQELADGQPEKYDFGSAQEESVDGVDCYRIEGKLKQGVESKFPRVVLLISKQNFAAVDAKFYDNRDNLARDLVVKKTEQIAGRWTRVRWTIDNPARGKKVNFEALRVSYDQKPKDSIFTREHLKRIASR